MDLYWEKNENSTEWRIRTSTLMRSHGCFTFPSHQEYDVYVPTSFLYLTQPYDTLCRIEITPPCHFRRGSPLLTWSIINERFFILFFFSHVADLGPCFTLFDIDKKWRWVGVNLRRQRQFFQRQFGRIVEIKQLSW